MWQDFVAFYKQPFSEDMTALGWLMFLGLLISICIFWQLVLRHVFME